MMILNIDLPPRTAGIICIALAILTGFTAIYAMWQWQQDWVLAHRTPTMSATLPKADESALLIAEIPEAHLFGQSLNSGDVPITNLQFQVTGIVKTTDGDGTTSKAYISISGAPGKIFQAGDSLPYGVKVYEITPDAVILENDGRLEKLPLPREKLEFKPFNTDAS